MGWYLLLCQKCKSKPNSNVIAAVTVWKAFRSQQKCFFLLEKEITKQKELLKDKICFKWWEPSIKGLKKERESYKGIIS